MTKSLFIDPTKTRKAESIRFTDIPVNAYAKTVKEAQGDFSREVLLRVFDEMAAIREYEGLLLQLKQNGQYNGISYNLQGPAHLAIGQEAAAVGQAIALKTEDVTFGTHRSHGELLARGMEAIATLSEARLMQIMRQYNGGAILRVLEDNLKGGNVRELAADFLFYGSLSEIFACDNGFQRGLSGSMHVFFPPFGIYPNNAIVGGAAGMATGSALFKKVNEQGGIAVANLGDGAVGSGAVFEAMNFACMDQFNTLWERKGGLPVLFNFFNNGYAMGGQTRGETMAYDMLARLGAGVSPTQLYSERVDGYNPLAVAEATSTRRKLLLQGKGAAMLDVVTYRYCNHSQSDRQSYRTEEEIEAWRSVDVLDTYRKQLIDAKLATDVQLDKQRESARAAVERAFMLASNGSLTAYRDKAVQQKYVQGVTFSNGSIDSLSDTKSALTLTAEGNERLAEIAKKVRFVGYGAQDFANSDNYYNVCDALFEAICYRYCKDASFICYGQELRDWGGSFSVFRSLSEALPYHRLFNAPISEATIVSTAVGYALSGGRVLIELSHADFLARCADELFNQLAKWQGLSGGLLRLPVVVRVAVGAAYGAQHAQDWCSLPAHVPGLKVVYPVTPYDCKGMLNAALQGTDPVIFFESQSQYSRGEHFHAEGVPQGYYEIPLGIPNVKRSGKDITVLTVGGVLYRAMEAAERLSKEYGVEAEIIDARSIVPFDYTEVSKSVCRTGRILLLGDTVTRGSVLNDFAANITSLCFGSLKVAPVVFGAANGIAPPTQYAEAFYPDSESILDCINARLIPLNGRQTQTEFSLAEIVRRAKDGV